MNEMIKTPEFLFESSWEVCNKVGGIYTVLSTKAHTLQQIFNDKVIFIGPDGQTQPLPILRKTHLCLRIGESTPRQWIT